VYPRSLPHQELSENKTKVVGGEFMRDFPSSNSSCCPVTLIPDVIAPARQGKIHSFVTGPKKWETGVKAGCQGLRTHPLDDSACR